jgi:MoaA/NifB/PqqE/SkfB family radical SAM enzyme
MEPIYRFFNCPVPVTGCNLRCDYCYIVQQGNESRLDFSKTKEYFEYSVGHMVESLKKERLGGVCAFHLCGIGETFLWAEIVDFAIGLLRNGHYVSFTSNCTITKPLKQLAELPAEFRAKLFFKCSFHWREFKKRNLLETFTQNIAMLKKVGISFSVEIVTNDYILNELDDIKSYSLEHFGALPHVLTQRDEENPGVYPRKSSALSLDEYAKTWGAFDSDLFTYHQSTWDLKREGYCYAGVYSFEFILQNGNVYPCPGNLKKVTNLFENKEEPAIFTPVGHNCPFSNCFFGFVTDILAGVDRESKSLYFFRDFRDRTCADDGSHWMSETMRYAYGHRCAEQHEDFGSEKKFYLDMLMRMWYKGIEPNEEEKQRLVSIIGERLRISGVNTVAVYGMAVLGQWLVKILKTAGIKVPFSIDRRYAEINDGNILVQSPDCAITDVDAVIVTPYAEFGKLAPMLREKTSALLISIIALGD